MIGWRVMYPGQFKMAPSAGSKAAPPNDVTALSRDREAPAAELADDESCRYDVVGSPSLRSGRLYSPRYPRNFSPYVHCVYRLEAGIAADPLDGTEKVFVSLLSVELGGGHTPPRPRTSRSALSTV